MGRADSYGSTLVVTSNFEVLEELASKLNRHCFDNRSNWASPVEIRGQDNLPIGDLQIPTLQILKLQTPILQIPIL